MGEDVLLNEKWAVEARGQKVNYNAGFHSRMIGFIGRAATPLYVGDACLVLGPSEGGEQEATLGEHFSEVVCVDGSSRVLGRLRSCCPSYEYIHSLFEEVDFERRFGTILMMHILEHIEDPVGLLRRAQGWLAPGGRIIITVPNAHSLHRMLGVEMGMLGDVHDLNDADVRVGHRRVYDWDSLQRDIEQAGLTIAKKGGVFLKPFSNAQMEGLTPEQLEGLYRLGGKFPENAAEILFVCS